MRANPAAFAPQRADSVCMLARVCGSGARAAGGAELDGGWTTTRSGPATGPALIFRPPPSKLLPAHEL